jgi:hypothetical protein
MKVKLCRALLRILLICTLSYLKLVPRYNFFNFDTYHSGTLYLRERGHEDSWLFFEAKRGPRAK